MRTAQLRNVLLEAVAAAGVAHAGCTPSTPNAGRTPEVAIPPAPTSRPEPAPASPAPSSSVPAPSASGTGPTYRARPELAAECVDGFRNVLRDLRPAASFDYVELRQRLGTEQEKPLIAHGNVCAAAADAAACHRELAKNAASGFGSACHPAHCDFHLIVTDARGVERLETAAEVARFVGPVDTPSEALLLAFANGHWVLDCAGPLPVRSGAAWALTINQTIEECPVVTADVAFSIAADGTVKIVGTHNRKKTGMCIGRRPPGLVEAHTAAASWIGDYLAGSAYLEAASAPAFERLGCELARLGAPGRLRTACVRAARDERRHARIVSRLARRYAADVPNVTLSDVAPRDALTLALDNAVEGCVRETYGAAVGWYQARRARDPEVRRAFREIARDETRHAALAWSIAAWLEARLSTEQAETVRAARRGAIAALRRELQGDPPAAAASLLGLPDARAALDVCAALEETLWNREPRALD